MWQTPSAAVISATGVVHDKWHGMAKVSIKKLRKSLNPNWLKRLKRTKIFFLHMPEAKAKEKSKLDH